MRQPDYTSFVFNGQWPVRVSNGGKDYFIFQILNEQGFAADILYCDMSRHGADDLIEKVAKAWIQKRKLKIWLNDLANKIVDKVDLA